MYNKTQPLQMELTTRQNQKAAVVPSLHYHSHWSTLQLT